MKIVRQKPHASGKREVVVMLEPGEELVAVRGGQYYRLGYPVADIVPEHVLVDAVPVSWCPVEQRWVE